MTEETTGGTCSVCRYAKPTDPIPLPCPGATYRAASLPRLTHGSGLLLVVPCLSHKKGQPKKRINQAALADIYDILDAAESLFKRLKEIRTQNCQTED